MYEKANKAADYLREKLYAFANGRPDIAIILGSGADIFLDSFKSIASCSFEDIPGMPRATFHKGSVHLAKTPNGKLILILIGRLHYYEGYSAQEITFPIRILQQLQIKTLFMTNASGGLNPTYKAGQIVLVRDHINLMPEHPLRGINDERLGLRFPDMSNAYDSQLRKKIGVHYQRLSNKAIKEGVYIGFQGPSLETPAEYNYLNKIGGDMVGMSTVPEVIVANHAGIAVCVLSIVTNVCYPPDQITPTTVEEVKEMAAGVTPIIAEVVTQCIDN